MREEYHLLDDEEADLGTIEDSLTELNGDTVERMNRYGDLLHYDGNSIEAVFSKNRAYVLHKNGTNDLSELAVLAFLCHDSTNLEGIDATYQSVGRTEFVNYSTGNL